MEEQLTAFMELCSEPMLALREERLVYANAAARSALGPAARAEGHRFHLPALLNVCDAKQYTAAVELEGREYEVVARRFGELQVLAFSARQAEGRESVLSDGLLLHMMNALTNLGLAAKLLSGSEPEKPLGTWSRELAVLRHNYFVLLRYVNNLSSLCQLERGAMLLFPAEVDLVALSARLADSVSVITRGTYAPLRFHTALETLTARVDRGKTACLLLNLLSNSLAHTPSDGEIVLSLAQQGDYAVYSLEDNGSGIPPEVMKDIFKPRRQAVAGARGRAGDGAGLGLPIAAGLARLHGGSLLLESRENMGTSVRVMLPLMREGVFQAPFRQPETVWEPMELILTEFSELLDYSFYDSRFSD